ncbi:hypothetical protein OGAPHI_002028 [Ogataea philodendri]|uniref:Actin-related protein 4 n=1 Tax=Ogataea philodendri TaxID=1378263 RepID=A0A9P8PB77_9ASCO|nr:uncharacterized protein OGAPHI_002028 [Ogataea philodendri]KAH3668274.1 hypothetical protein OGAPHI_002028 [Ogataea philodendri]
MTSAPQVYGADEIDAIVVDPGTFQTKIGYAGYDSPSLVLPSYYGEVDLDGNKRQIFDESLLFLPQKGLEVKHIVENNAIVDWDGFVAQLEYVFKKLDVKPEQQPVLLTESTFSSYDSKVKALDVFLDTFKFCAFYLVKQPTTVSFAHGRPNCLVVDVGHDLVTVTPIVDGLCLKNQVMGTKYAGAFLNQQLEQFLADKGIELRPHYMIKSKKIVYYESPASKAEFQERKYDFEVSKSFHEFAKLKVLQEMKETLLSCIEEEGDEPKESDDQVRWFELPDGLAVPFTKKDRAALSNSLFSPLETLSTPITGFETPDDGNIIKRLGHANETSSKEYVPMRRAKKPEEDKMDEDVADVQGGIGLIKLVQTVLDRLDIDLKPQLANNIVLVGSTSLVPGLNAKLHSELSLMNPSLKIRIHAAGNTIERRYSSWVGGSILSSLGTFHQLWVTKAEYETVGAEKLIVNRFR